MTNDEKLEVLLHGQKLLWKAFAFAGALAATALLGVVSLIIKLM